MIKLDIIRAYALKNAVEHGGSSKAGPIINSLFNHGLEKNKVRKIMPRINDVLNEINSLSVEEQKILFEKHKDIIGHRPEREGLPEIPVGRRGVVTRMSPSASGPLHIGHVIILLPNFLYAEKYNGKFYIRIEDTNPNNIDPKAYKMIEKDANWICNGNVEIVIQSERMNLYYEYAKRLINKGYAYVCECDSEEFREMISKMKECPCRDIGKKGQIGRWGKMLDKKGYGVGEAVLRFKSNIKDPNPAMRDFPLARINISKHALQGRKFRVWPLMNLAVSVDDIEMGITHIIRGKDHIDNAKRQELIYSALGNSKVYPWIGFIGRLHFNDLELSTTKMREGIEIGKYSGWDDKKLPTVISLKKHGHVPESFYKFVEHRGISEVDKTISKEDFFKAIEDLEKK